jgi:TPR repeat protein
MRAFLRASLVGLALLLAAPAVGQDFQKGWAAAQRGNYATALREWRPLAEQGDAGAQYNLGGMYMCGQGVPQGHMWFNLAAVQGNETAAKNRDIAVSLMTPGDLSTAQKMAREWLEKHPQ